MNTTGTVMGDTINDAFIIAGLIGAGVSTIITSDSEFTRRLHTADSCLSFGT